MNSILKQLTINPSNKLYYSEDFIKGFECGTQRQLEADKAKMPTWIPCSERMPEKPFECVVTVWDTNSYTMDEYESVLPYLVGWDGEQWNDDMGEQCPFEVLAWMPLPEPWKGADDD